MSDSTDAASREERESSWHKLKALRSSADGESGDDLPPAVRPTPINTLDPKTEAHNFLRAAKASQSRQRKEELQTRRQETQFSLLELVIFFTFASIGLASSRWLYPQWFVGIGGFASVFAMLLFWFFPLQHRIAKNAFVAAVITYFLAAFSLLFRDSG